MVSAEVTDPRITNVPQTKLPNGYHALSGRSPGVYDFATEVALGNQGFGASNRLPNRAFARPSNRLPTALKNLQKILFIQQLADRDFALCASPLSWHK
jgi:hypothetical protein